MKKTEIWQQAAREVYLVRRGGKYVLILAGLASPYTGCNTEAQPVDYWLAKINLSRARIRRACILGGMPSHVADSVAERYHSGSAREYARLALCI